MGETGEAETKCLFRTQAKGANGQLGKTMEAKGKCLVGTQAESSQKCKWMIGTDGVRWKASVLA